MKVGIGMSINCYFQKEKFMKRLRGVKHLAVIVFLMGLSLNTWAHTDVTPEEAKDMI